MILVLGNEGHGIRTNILNRCDVLVKLSASRQSSSTGHGAVQAGEEGDDDLDRDDPSEGSAESGVDSLNVSVAGGIMMYHVLGHRQI